MDLDFRLKAGEKSRFETYLRQYPELANERGMLLGLIRAEYKFRSRREAGITVEEYLKRFPQYQV